MEQEKINCKYCNAEINKWTMVCPYCGKSQLEATRKKSKGLWYVLGLILLTLIIYFTFTEIVPHEKVEVTEVSTWIIDEIIE